MKVARVNARRDPILSSPSGVGGGNALPALDDLTDVDTSGVADGDTIVFDSGTSTWLPGAGGGGGTIEVDGDGTPVVAAATILDFLAGFTVADAGGGRATVAVDFEAATSAYVPIMVANPELVTTTGAATWLVLVDGEGAPVMGFVSLS
jgi:hypothetical protein